MNCGSLVSAPCCKELGYTVHDQACAHFVIQCPFIYMMMVHARHSMLESEFRFMSFANWNQLLAHVAIAVPIFKMTFAGARMKSNDVQCFNPFSFLDFTKLVNEFFSWKNTR